MAIIKKAFIEMVIMITDLIKKVYIKTDLLQMSLIVKAPIELVITEMD